MYFVSQIVYITHTIYISQNWTDGKIGMGSQYEREKVGITLVQEELNGLRLVQFECPRHLKPPVSSNFEVGRFPFSHNWTSGVIEWAPSMKVKNLE